MPRPATHFIPTGWTPCYTASPIIRNTCPTTGLTRTFSSCKRRSEEHTSELQSRLHLVCRLLLEKKNPKPGEVTGDGDRRRPHRRRDPALRRRRHHEPHRLASQPPELARPRQAVRH